MVIYLDIDKFLKKADFGTFLIHNIAWPWSATHFVLSEKCFGCGSTTNNILNSLLPHFVIAMNVEQIRLLLESNFFWCKACKIFCVYDHYPEDECVFCNV